MKVETEQMIIEFMEAGGELENLPPKVKRLLELLLEERKELLARVQELEEAQEKGKKNSRNSSKPPSQDGPETPAKAEKPKRGRSRGGQVGHQKFSQALYGVEGCTEVHVHKPKVCQCCDKPLTDESCTVKRYQYIELPKIELKIVEHQLHEMECVHCGTVTAGEMPANLPKSHYGERLTALIGLLRGYHQQSHQKVKAFLRDVLGLSMSTGQINRLSQEVSEALETCVQEAQAYVQQAAVVGSDETSFPQRNGDGNNPQKAKGWLWVVTSPAVVFFRITLSRSQAIAQELLGGLQEKMPIVISDRYGAYNWIPLKFRQICWSHLIRDLTAIAERSGASGEVGRTLLKKQRRLFRWWHKYREENLPSEVFVEAVRLLRQGFKQELEEVASFHVVRKDKSLWAKTIRTCREILKVEEGLWTFVFVPRVEPTNNASEQAIRSAVIWRRISYGTQSQAGSQFVARILTVTTSLKRLNRPIFEFLVNTMQTKRYGGDYPSLLPSL